MLDSVWNTGLESDMYTVVILIGYLLGTLSPAALLSKAKNINLRTSGSGNLGATNTMMVLGKGYGLLVMVLDIGKSYLAVKLSQLLFPKLAYAGLVAGFAAVVGHIYPFYMKFKGGKGLATYGGLIIALHPRMVLLLLILCVSIMIVFNDGVAMAISVCTLYPILCLVSTGDWIELLLLIALGLLVILNHRSNLQESKQKTHIKVRTYIKEHFLR